MIDIRTTFTPFKLKISRREPVSLSIEIENDGKEAEIVSLELHLGQQFSLEKTGFKTSAEVRIPDFKPGDVKKFYYDIWPKQAARLGMQPIKLLVIEHYQGFNYVKKKYDKTLQVNVEE